MVLWSILLSFLLFYERKTSFIHMAPVSLHEHATLSICYFFCLHLFFLHPFFRMRSFITQTATSFHKKITIHFPYEFWGSIIIIIFIDLQCRKQIKKLEQTVDRSRAICTNKSKVTCKFASLTVPRMEKDLQFTLAAYRICIEIWVIFPTQG